MQRLLTSPLALRAAELLGTATRHVSTLGRSVPGAAGALLVAAGAYEAWHPLGLITAGAFLLVLDRRVP